MAMCTSCGENQAFDGWQTAYCEPTCLTCDQAFSDLVAEWRSQRDESSSCASCGAGPGAECNCWVDQRGWSQLDSESGYPEGV